MMKIKKIKMHFLISLLLGDLPEEMQLTMEKMSLPL